MTQNQTALKVAKVSQVVKNAILYNARKEKEHKQKMTVKKIDKKKYSINQFFTNNDILYNELVQNFTILADMREWTDEQDIDDEDIKKITYIHDKEFKSKKLLDFEILKLIITLIYQNDEVNFNNKEVSKIFYLAYYLSERGFRCPFKILTKNRYLKDLTDIKKLYKYICSGGKTPKPNFNEDKINENIIINNENLNCCVCLEDYNIIDNNFVSCQNCINLQICAPCFGNLNPRRCPICRTNYINLVNKDLRQIKFIYNNQTFKKDISLEDIEENEIMLIYLDVMNEYHPNIKYITLNIDSHYDIINDFINNKIDDRAIYYKPDFIRNHLLPVFDGVIDNDFIEALQDNENYNIINRILGFNNLTLEEENANRRKFFDDACETDAEKDILRYDIYDKIIYNTNNKHTYILYSHNYLENNLFTSNIVGHHIENFDLCNNYNQSILIK
jgi:hypothetical protein